MRKHHQPFSKPKVTGKFYFCFVETLMFLFSLLVILCSKCIKLILNSLELRAYYLKMLILLCEYYYVKSLYSRNLPGILHFVTSLLQIPVVYLNTSGWWSRLVGRAAFPNPNVASCLSRQRTVFNALPCYLKMLK